MITTTQMTWSFLLGAMNTVSSSPSAACLSLISFVAPAKPFTRCRKRHLYLGHEGILSPRDRLSEPTLTWEVESLQNSL